MYYKSGFVNIIGNSNVGKSSLINILIGNNISIISSKVQTTQDRILGILNKEKLQIIFSDTPGIIMPNCNLGKKMMFFVKESLKDADLILYVTDINNNKIINNFIYNKIINSNIPILVLINKIDNFYNKNYDIDHIVNFWKNNFPKAIDILPISIIKKINIDILLNKIINLIPYHPPYYPIDILTNKPKKFFVNEIIREKIFFLYDKELPYIIKINTEIFKEYKNIIYIYSILLINNISQKRILIGYKGNNIKKLHIKSIFSLENFFNKKIKLQIQIKILK